MARPPLPPGQRYRCTGCGNLTRFDVEVVERVRRFWHADLGGRGSIEDEETLDAEVLGVTCRWCGRSDAIDIVDVPRAAAPPAGAQGPAAATGG